VDNEVYIVYAIISKKDGRLYVGFTKDIEQRLKWHNQGKTKSTKGYRPWKLYYTEKVKGRLAARRKCPHLMIPGFGLLFFID